MTIIKPREGIKLYKQEGKIGIFQALLWAIPASRATTSYVPVSWGEFYVFFKKNYLGVYWDERGFEKVACYVLEVAKDGLPADWQERWEKVDAELTQASHELADLDLSNISDAELKERFDRIFKLDQEMWLTSIFIDTFDPGFDQERMHQIAKEQGFTDEEVQTLVSPVIPAFVTEWDMALQDLKRGKIERRALKERFFWYATNYYLFGELTNEFIDVELSKIQGVSFHSSADKQAEILKKYNLEKNPLILFQSLTTWRDIRKRLNYTGLYGLLKILREVLRRQNIDPDLAGSLTFEQLPQIFGKQLDEPALRKQFEEGMLFHSVDGEEAFYKGANATETWDYLEKEAKSHGLQEFSGMVASRGKATGKVRVVPHITHQSAEMMEPGEILVTSMTRPEFLPLMKKAGAIVTNEGGITSHAAIVSRELGIPCIIGTKIATQVLHDGDLVEVDAEKGIVKVLS